MFSSNIRNLIFKQFKQTKFKNLSIINLRFNLNEQNKFINKRRFCTTDDQVKVNFILKDGSKRTIVATVGQNVMEVAQDNDIDIEGACAASLACCTCHVYVKQEYFDKLNEICDLEEDMLDQAPFLKENSRLSCQIILTKELDNIEVQLPAATRNFYVDGHKPQAH